MIRGFLGASDEGPATVAGGVGTAGAFGNRSLSFSMCVFSTIRSLSVVVSLVTSRSRDGLWWLRWLRAVRALWRLRPGLRPRSLGE